MIELFEENGLFGIREHGKVLVPPVHETKKGAVEEWQYFELENIKKQFLKQQLDIDKIKKITKLLLEG